MASPAVVRVADALTTVIVLNTTDVPLRVVALDRAGAEQRIGELAPGERRELRVVPGQALKFLNGAQLLGDAYVVEAGSRQEISVPYHDPRTASQPAEELAGVAVRFTNTTTTTITVAEADAAKNVTPMYDIAPGQTETRRAKPNAKLYFYPADSDDPVGDAFLVGGADDKVSIPYHDPAKTQRPVQAADHGARPGGVAVQFTNTSAQAITVAEASTGGGADPLYDIAPGKTETRQAQPNALLYFYPAGSDTAVGDAFLVTGKGDKVSIPYRDPAKARPPATTGNNGAKLDAGKPGGVAVQFTNTSAKAVTVAEGAGSDADALYDIAPGKTETRQAKPNATLYFFDADKKTVIGDSYVVTGKGDKVTIPYADPARKALTLAELVASGKIDLKAIAAKISLSIIQERLNPKSATICWRNTYGRGVGTIPRFCPRGQSEDTAGLCYNKCRRGYKGAVTMCVPECPPGFREDGLYCFKPAPIARDEYPWKFGDGLSMNDAMARCRRKHGGNCVVANANTMVYSTCPSGYRQAPVVTNLCTPVCPSNTVDIGVSCQKQTYDRGVGKLMSCAANQQRDAGLCYNSCNAGFSGVGPVCWAACPASLPVNCGASCAKDKGECALAVTDQVTTPFMAAANVALIALTAGAGAGATAGLNAAKAGAQTAGKSAAQLAGKATAKEAARKALKNNVRQALKAMSAKAAKSGATAVAKEQAIDLAVSAAVTGAVTIGLSEQAKADLKESLSKEVREALADQISDEQIDSVVNMAMEGAGGGGVDFDWASLDPIGIASIVQAYNFPVCAKIK